MKAPTDSDAVSSVVGVILLVAITVLLAAIIGAITFGFTDSIGNAPTAGISVDETATELHVSLVDVGNSDEVIVRDPQREVSLTTVGERARLDRTGCYATVIAVKDGSETVIQTIHASLPDSSGELVSFWSFEDCQISGDRIIDATGKQAGTLEGGVTTSVAGVSGRAVHFDGDDDQILIGSRGSHKNISVSFWVKPDGGGWIAGEGAKWRIRSDPADDTFVWWIRNNSAENWGATSIQGGPGEEIDDEWWHVVGTYEDSDQTMRLYVNGQKVAEDVSIDGIGETGHSNMVIGSAYEGSSGYGSQTVDELRISNTALNPGAVVDLCERDAPADHVCAGS